VFGVGQVSSRLAEVIFVSILCSPSNMRSQDTASWDEVADSWSAGQPQSLWRSYCDVAHKRWLDTELGERRFRRALKTDAFDELAGEGGLARALADRADRMVQIDISQRALHHARGKAPQSQPTAADVRELPFADGSFDLVFSNSTLDHLDSLEQVAESLAELCRVLSPGGVLLITMDNLRNPVIALRNGLPERLLTRHGVVPYQLGPTCGPGKLRRMLREAGFDSVSLRALMHCPRLPAIRLAAAKERRGNVSGESFIRGAMGWERLADWPTRYWTGYFVAASAIRADPDRPSSERTPRLQRDKMSIPRAKVVLDYAKHRGPRRAFARGAYVLANQAIALSIFDCMYMRPEHVNRSLVEPEGAYSGRFLEPDEAAGFARELDAPGQRVVGEAVERGDACYAVLDGDRLANIGFYASNATPLLNDLVVHFEEPSWYMYGAYTPEAYRGYRLHGRGVVGGCLGLFDRGAPSLVTLYERTNYRSMVSALRMGWQPCGSIYRIGIGPWTHLGRTARAREIGMRLALRSEEPAA
jgi:SAM-dependent methyltransferase